MPQLEHHTIEQHSPRLAFLIRQFHRGMERQHQKDRETLASLVRALSNPRGLARADAEKFVDFVRSIADELDGRN